MLGSRRGTRGRWWACIGAPGEAAPRVGVRKARCDWLFAATKTWLKCTPQARVARSATSVASVVIVPGPRRRALAGAGLWVSVVAVAGCPGQPEAVSAPQGRSAAAAGSMVPAATRDVKLPSAHLSSSEPSEDPTGDPAVKAGDTPAGGDPRAVPPGTPPAIARVFQRLPVAIHDGPPLAAIGATGIHVDKIWLGTTYEKDGCASETERFSLARDSQVNVCFRVVHSREEEAVEVEWIKDGAVFRRRGVNIPDIHAYRSRAYLVLRREYIGAWKARVLSADGFELAAVEFTVTP